MPSRLRHIASFAGAQSGFQWSGSNASLTVEQWPCEYLDTPTSLAFLADGRPARPDNFPGTYWYVGMTDTAHGGCGFDPESDATWITFGRTYIGFTVEAAANPSAAPRSTLVRISLVVGARRITVTQAGR